MYESQPTVYEDTRRQRRTLDKHSDGTLTSSSKHENTLVYTTHARSVRRCTDSLLPLVTYWMRAVSRFFSGSTSTVLKPRRVLLGLRN